MRRRWKPHSPRTSNGCRWSRSTSTRRSPDWSARLVKWGQRVETIAARFGVTERLVKQRLALANLTDAIKREVRKGGIAIADAQILALATPKQQKAWFKLYRNQEQYAPQGSQLKAWLCGGAAISTEVALFPLADYPGRLVTDLFGEETFFDDRAQFWTLQNQAITALRDRWQTVGLRCRCWRRAIISEVGSTSGPERRTAVGYSFCRSTPAKWFVTRATCR